MEAFE